MESHGLQDYIFRVIVAEQEVPVMKNGQPTGKTKMKNLYPGYIFVEMIMSDEAWFVIRNTPGVTGFVGSSGRGAKPFPVTRVQIETVLKKVGMVDEQVFTNYNVGDRVKVLRGAFEGVEGDIISVNAETGEVKILITLLGRPQEVEVECSEIDKI